MARVVITERFISDAAGVWSGRVSGRIERALHTLEAFPESGSPVVPDSIRAEFGDGVRRIVVVPFDLVYEYDATQDTAFVYRLIPCASAR